ncbi:MAG: hypothetical protein AAGF49_16425, partial [Pseudomonadota bacterium]
QIDLAIVNYRPVFVIGDVKAPGSYAFQPHLSVVQAVGLAGGPATALSNEEDRLLKRATLRSDLDVISSDIAREAVSVARLQAQLDGRDTIAPTDLPSIAEDYLNSVFVGVLMDAEERLLKVDMERSAVEQQTLQAAIAAARNELTLLRDVAENERKAIGFAEASLERFRELHKRNHTSLAVVSEAEAAVGNANSEHMSALAAVSQAEQRIGQLETDLYVLDAQKRRGALQELQERQVAIEKLLSSHRSVIDQLALVAGWSAQAAAEEDTVRLTYVIRRRVKNGFDDTPAEETSFLAPGDVLIVALTKDTVPGG